MSTGAGDGYAEERAAVAALFDDEGRNDPHAALRTLAHLPTARHETVDAMLRDPRFNRVAPQSAEPLWAMLARWLISLDGERHRRLRARFVGLFGPRVVERFRVEIQSRADELIDAVATDGQFELVSGFARPLPFSVITRVLGLGDVDRAAVGANLLTMNRAFAHQDDPEHLARGHAAAGELARRFERLLEERSADPRDDLLSTLAADLPDDADERADLVANCVFFIEAGHATTTSLIASGVALLLEHGGMPASLPRAVEEVLRLTTPVTSVMCAPRDDVEVDGCRFAAGVPRHAFLAAANRDPEVFPDPDRFDPDRDPNPHLAFAAGRHFCLGAPLARLHGEIALATLLRRLPGLRLDGEPEWRGSLPLRELERLPVAWD
jgi:cytochrome P450